MISEVGKEQEVMKKRRVCPMGELEIVQKLTMGTCVTVSSEGILEI